MSGLRGHIGLMMLAGDGAVFDSGYSDQVVADVPLGYWRLAETSGTTAEDSSGSGLTGDYINAAGITRGLASLVRQPTDKSISLPGSGGNYINLSSPAALKLASNFTFEAVIVAPTAGAIRAILSYGNGGFCLCLDETNHLWALKSWVVSRGTSTGVLTPGTKYHVAATVDSAGVLTFYINGVASGTGTTASDYGAPSGVLTIGVDHAATVPWLGPIDEVAVYGTALSAERIAAHAAAALA